MSYDSNSLDLKSVVGKDQLSQGTASIIDNILDQINNFDVSVEGTGDLFDCAINLGDLISFDLDLDFFKKRSTGMSYTLLYKIQQLKRYISRINDIFIELIGNLECCNTDDKYNKLVLPIFKWLVEDENGLTGTLSKISKELYTIYLPLKRIQCLFKPLPGNPTLSFGGYDYFKAIYPIIEGIGKTMNMIDNGRFLDIIIIPVKNFHDKLVACSSGSDVDLYTKYDSISDLISTSMYDELTASLIDELKAQRDLTESGVVDQPKPPKHPTYTEFYASTPRPLIDTTKTELKDYYKELAIWNKAFTAYKNDIDREYNKLYADYLDDLKEYNEDKFKSTLELTKADYTSSNLTVDLSVEDFKNKFKPICGCLAEIFNADGFFFPKDKIIRSEKDLLGLIGEVEYKGISSDNYYFDDDLGGKKRVKIISKQDLVDIRLKPIVNDIATAASYALNLSTLGIGTIPESVDLTGLPQDLVIKLTPKYSLSDYTDKIGSVKNVGDVIQLDTELNALLLEKKKHYKILSAFIDTVNNSFSNLYKDEISKLQNNISRLKAEMVVTDLTSAEKTAKKNLLIEYQRELTNYAFMPPKSWDKESTFLTGGYSSGIGKISYSQYELLADSLTYIDWEIVILNQAIMRNHAVIKLVDEDGLECGCDLLCMVIKYIISLILEVIKKVITYIVTYLLKSIMNKELQWWLEFISQKINCILDILNLGDEIDEMRARFDAEIEYSKGLLNEASSSLGNCVDTDTQILTDMILYDERAKLDQSSISDITWQETNYPEFVDDTIDVTQDTVDDNKFTLELENITFEDTEWKNRSIPTIITDCAVNHKVLANWTPPTNSWSAYLNLTININQFNGGDYVLVTGNDAVTEEDLINTTYDTIIWNLINRATNLVDFNFKIEISGSSTIYSSNDTALEDNYLLINSGVGSGTAFNLETIDRVWFYLDDVEIKVFDRLQSDSLKSLYNSTKDYMTNLTDGIENESVDFDVELPTSMKVCSASSLVVTKFEPLYNDTTLSMYPGTITKGVVNGVTQYVLTPKQDLVTLEYFKRNNVPFVMELENLSGRIFKIILLIDICAPNNVKNTGYNKSVDGVFLNNRYDLLEYASVPNNVSTIFLQDDIIDKLTPILEEDGIISSFLPGMLSSLNNSGETDSGFIDNTETEEIYDSSLDFSGQQATVGYGNLPDGPIKEAIYKQQAKLQSMVSLINDTETYFSNLSVNLEAVAKTTIENSEEAFNNLLPDSILNNEASKLGIPIMVLNQDENIILTIENKKLKLLNINRNFGILDPDLVVAEVIDYEEGENLFIQFSTTGFTHTISWLNERKKYYSATITTTTVIELKPTYLGSVYSAGYTEPIALLCGKINDIIFTDSSRTPEEWCTNSNTYRPDGTIGFYDFSLFDGYHVYSIPEFFRITTFGELATVKGILYESSTYTKEEIAIKIQDGKINELEQTKLTVVGERPISVGGDFIWKNTTYYKNITFGYLDNFFCRDNLKDKSFTISFWLRQKDSLTNLRTDFTKKYIISDTNNGNFVWLEENVLYIQLFNQPLRSEPVYLLFKEDIYAAEPIYVEKWFNHVFRYDRDNAKVYYDIKPINDDRTFSDLYDWDVLSDKKVIIPLKNVTGKGKVIDFSLVTLLARYDMKTLMYTDQFHAEITALAIWTEFKSDSYLENMFNYQRRIIINEMN